MVWITYIVLMCKATHYDSSGKNGPLQKIEGTSTKWT